jgi:hypothetical protein
MSAIGSERLIVAYFLSYQLAFFMPGTKPWLAMFRRQMRQILNLRYTERDRPQSWQRRMIRLEYFGFRLAFAISAFVAIRIDVLTVY